MGAKEDYNTIVVSSEPRGRFINAYVSGTPKPGTVMQLKAATAKIGGRHTYEAYNRALDGDRPQGPICILLEDQLQGKTIDDAYADGELGMFYFPLPGDELLVIAADESVARAIGDIFIVDDTTGHAIATTGTPETEPFVCMEAYADPVGVTMLTHVMFSGF